jgi:hypothetical protein
MLAWGPTVPLSASATLEGFGTFQQTVFHTYVKSSCGTSWGCHGGHSGGGSICKGTGSSFEADCIEGKDEAAVSYLVTGVCHQIANRILAAAGVILPEINGQIRGTYAVWEEYGWDLPFQPPFDQWPNRKIICAARPPGGQSAGSKGPSSGSASFSIRQFTIGSSDVINSGSNPLVRRSRLGALIQAAGISHPVDDSVLDGLAKMQAGLQARQRELGELVATQQISREKYIVEFDKALKEACQIGEDLLGFDSFHKVFGEFRIKSMGDVSAFIAGRSAAQ